MSDYTPTTEDIRTAWTNGYHGDNYPGAEGSDAEFDRWLAGHGPAIESPEEFRAHIDAERLRQVEYGYDRAHDEQHGVDHLLVWAQDFARRGKAIASAALIEVARELLAAPAGQGEEQNR